MIHIPTLPGTLSNVTDPDNHNNTDPTIELEDTSSCSLLNLSASTNPALPEAIEASISLQPASKSTTTALDQLKHCLPIFNASHHNDKTEPVDLNLSINSIETPPVNSVWLQDNNFLAVTLKSLYSAAYKFNDFLKDHDPFPFPVVAAQFNALYGMQNNYNTINNFQTAPSFGLNSQIGTTNYGQASSNSLTGSNVYQMPSVGNYQSSPPSASYSTSFNPVSTPPAVSTTYYSSSHSNPISTPPSNFYAGPPLATPIVAPSYSPSFSSAPLYSPSLAPTNTFAHTYAPNLSPNRNPVFAPMPSPVDDLRKPNPLFTPTPTYIPTFVQDANERLKKRERESQDEKLKTFPTVNPFPTTPAPSPINFANTAPTLGNENFGSTHTSPTIFTEPIPEPASSPVSGFAAAPDPDKIYFIGSILSPQDKQHEAAIRAQDLREISSRLKNVFRNLYVNGIGRDQDYIQSILGISPQLVADFLEDFKDTSLQSRWHLLRTSLVAETLFKKQTAKTKYPEQKPTSSSGSGGKDCDDPAAQAEFDKIPTTLKESEHQDHKGHAYTLHVDQTMQDFLERFAKQPERTELSSFSDAATAEKAYQEVLKWAKKSICDWLSDNSTVEDFEMDFFGQVGYGLKRGESATSPRYKAKFVFKKTKDGPRVFTAYPTE
jgi:hypothetical protein